MSEDPKRRLEETRAWLLARAKTAKAREAAERGYAAGLAFLARQAAAAPPPPALAPAPPPDKEKAKAKKSKRHVVAKLPAAWRQRVFAATETTRPASMLRKSVALLWLTGCRPAELEKGVQVSVLDRHLVVKISGAKCGVIDNGVIKARRGIETRLLKIPAAQNEASELLFKLATEAGGKIQVKYDAVALSNKVSEAGKKALKKKGISPYCYRHAMGCDLKSCDAIDDVFRARVMGHLSVESLAKYGRRRRGGGGPAPVHQVKTTADPHGARSAPPTPQGAPTTRPTA